MSHGISLFNPSGMCTGFVNRPYQAADPKALYFPTSSYFSSFHLAKCLTGMRFKKPDPRVATQKPPTRNCGALLPTDPAPVLNIYIAVVCGSEEFFLLSYDSSCFFSSEFRIQWREFSTEDRGCFGEIQLFYLRCL